jgi:hypothetical protein
MSNRFSTALLVAASFAAVGGLAYAQSSGVNPNPSTTSSQIDPRTTVGTGSNMSTDTPVQTSSPSGSTTTTGSDMSATSAGMAPRSDRN